MTTKSNTPDLTTVETLNRFVTTTAANGSLFGDVSVYAIGVCPGTVEGEVRMVEASHLMGDMTVERMREMMSRDYMKDLKHPAMDALVINYSFNTMSENNGPIWFFVYVHDYKQQGPFFFGTDHDENRKVIEMMG